MKSRGKFITFEGIDGAGKSTCLAFAREHLEAREVSYLSTREPGGTQVGEEVRSLLLDPRWHLETETECLLVFSARCEHVRKVIAPALAGGTWVLCDRFLDATYAYQGAGRGIEKRYIDFLRDWTVDGLSPDLTILVDAPVAVAGERIRARGGEVDRIEAEAHTFHERVREAYLGRASAEPGRIRCIASDVARDQVRAKVIEAIDGLGVGPLERGRS